jgi:ribosomal protein S18 acetylase RimI-like enzyme
VAAHTFTQVAADQRSAVLATLVSAFAADPVERWLYPDEQQYRTHFPRFLDAYGGRSFAQGTVWAATDLKAVALWLPPGSEADGGAIVSVLTESVSTDKHEEMYDVLGQMEAAHPTYPHWYLPWLGVDGSSQGRGLGDSLLGYCLEFVDRAGLPSYLETPNPRTVPFYQRHGFTVTGTTVSPTCPPLTFMTRPGSAD